MTDLVHLSNAIDLFDDFLDVGRFSFHHLSKRIRVVTEVGPVIRRIEEVGVEHQDIRMTEALENLGNKIYELSVKMNRNWDVLKFFMSENPIFGDVAQEAGTVTKFLQDTISHPCGHSFGIFGDACGKMSPLMNGYKLITLLEQDTTNALKKAMNEDILKRTNTFERWRGILDGVMTHFLFLESFCNGLFWEQNMYGPNNLKQKIAIIIGKFDDWKDEYKINYWPETVQQTIYKVQDQNQTLSNDQKARKLQGLLDQILTDDSFLIMVYDFESTKDHSFESSDNQLVTSFGNAGCNIAVYRSRSWKNEKEADIWRMKKVIEDCKVKAKTWTKPLPDLPKFIMSNVIPNSGFIGLIKDELAVAILSANNQNPHYATPGHWTCVSIGSNALEYILIAGFR
ncbi:hypothetical protein CAEBREN_04929 [Caenorhabditis brenneri]|uniref:Uncharacterized protein n=1 Tax=Caenorhabditis brenneri TaxID=135651 RepID=G0NF23_CAEBE|nr:hypothetical protein CAEBREN_04929 [Caenorhabditis brenneri]